ncbi:MAG TPA: hypothetical protein PLM53_10880 [Spirochaetota bacterium]|nr:hypothetical protein [Spirochaetota bacterium]HQF08705.1 hypothetical protein [Spirochaetota bacterium]HQH97594.1 hypothetical protein [Spirochaetota bacterium]HQJ71305.1 hypothetical protein [Spirochaetota bacterium]
MAQKQRSTIQKAVLSALLIALLCFILLEITVRIVQAWNPAVPIIPDTTYLQYRGRPGAAEFNGFRLNSRGFKDTEFMQKPPGRFRILSLGDSQTYGAVPYADSYMTLVENKLKVSCPRCEILNMGVPSAGPVDYLSALLNEGLDLAPDMVLLNFNLYDDFRNGGKRFKIYSCSAAASFINYLLAGIFEPEGRVFGTGMYREGIQLRSDESYLRLVLDAHGGIFQKNNDTFSRDFHSSFEFIERIKKICDSKQISFIVVIIPADLQIYPQLQNKAAAALNLRESDFDYRRPNRMLAKELRRIGIPYLDLLDTFLLEQARSGKGLTQDNDPHWNRYGSMAAAEAVSPWLRRLAGHRRDVADQN